MPQRDYITRNKTKKSGNKKILLIIAVIILCLMTAIGLYLLKESSPEKVKKPIIMQPLEQKTSKTNLPSRPEEVWSYIRDLETREIPTDVGQKTLEKVAALTDEQKKILKAMENEQRLQEEKRNKALSDNGVETTSLPTAAATTNTVKTAEKPKTESNRTDVIEPKKQDNLKKEKAEIVMKSEVPQPAAVKQPDAASKSVGKFGLQCGAFKNKAQAENMQARLVMAGYNARVNSSADWNRVVVGPLGDRATAVAAQSNTKSVTDCVVIGM